MGVSCSVIIGVYVEASEDSLSYVENIDTCPNTQCKNHGTRDSGKFCTECGTAIQNVGITRQGTMNWYTFLDVCKGNYNEDMFYSPEYLNGPDGYKILLTNLGDDRDFRVDSFDPEYGKSVVNFDDVDTKTMITKFEVKHKDLLAEMRTVFKEVNVRFGVVAYYS